MRILLKKCCGKLNNLLKNKLFNKIINILLTLLKYKDKSTLDHCKRVKKLCVGYTRYYNYSNKQINILKYASLLHDIGKIMIASKILNKSGKLSRKELLKIQRHPFLGFIILKYVLFLSEEAFVMKHHHERIDGCGYPDKLTGSQINELSKILSVCDAFDAMTNDRIYKKKLSFDDALKELMSNSGSQFDSKTVKNFCNYIIKLHLVIKNNTCSFI